MERADEAKTAVSEDTEEYREYEQCGYQIGCGSCKSKRWTCSVFSCCNNARGALFFLSCVAFFQGFVMNGLINIVITTLERRFSLSSSETGLIASSYDIGTCASLLFVTYVGGRGHKPLWLGWGTFIMGIGSIVFSLPHFIAPRYVISGAQDCENITSAACGEANLRVYRGFFLVSQLLHGIGASPLYTLALTYIDENVKQVQSSIYHGVFYAVSLIGPGLGYLLGGQLLTLYTNLDESVDVTTDSILWVGNWWVGFLIGGAAFFLLSIFVLMYPRQLPGTDKYRQNRETEMYGSTDAMATHGDENFGKSFKDLPRCVLVFLKNPTIVFITLAGAMDNGLVAGIATFGPKYFESMFTLPASEAAFIFGLLAIVSSAVGQIVGGVVVSKFNLSVKRMLAMCIVCSVAACGCFLAFLMKCENTQIAGATVPYSGESTINCSITDCGCSTTLYDPVCGADNLTYLSYCDAQCSQLNSTNFNTCQRIQGVGAVSTATRGKCLQNVCPNKELFAIIIALGVLFVFLSAQPALQASLRAVPFYQRSFAIGIQWLFLRLLGSIPTPNILGKLLDLSCVVWGIQCGTCGSCKVYDNASMSNYMTGVTVITKALSLIFFIVAWKTYKPAPCEETEETALEPTSKEITQDVTDNDFKSTDVQNSDSLPGMDRKSSQAHDNPNFEE